jgi:HEAT repeats
MDDGGASGPVGRGSSYANGASVAGTSEFVETLGRLIAAHRQGAGGAAVQARLLEDTVRIVAQQPMVVDAGLQLSGEYDEANLKNHLLRRQVETLRVAAGASAADLDALARALGNDALPLPRAPSIEYEMVSYVVPDAIPPRLRQQVQEARAAEGLVFLDPTAEATGERQRIRVGPVREIEELTAAIESAGRRAAWTEALHAAQALIRIAPRMPEEERRTFTITVKRAIPRPLLQGFIQFAIRTAEEQGRASEVLQWMGMDAVELMVDSIRESESAAPRQFLHETLARMPSAVPLLLPLLQSSRWYEVRNAADLLGRLQSAEALPPLKALLAHSDPRVRAAALEALSRYPGGAAGEAFRQGLTHATPVTRADAARAIGRRGSGAFAMPLVAALADERDPKTWSEMLRALARMDSPEALSAVVNIALRKKSVLRRGGYPVPQRLEAVALLAESRTEGARHALIRIAQEAEGEVGQAARTELKRVGG